MKKTKNIWQWMGVFLLVICGSFLRFDRLASESFCEREVEHILIVQQPFTAMVDSTFVSQRHGGRIPLFSDALEISLVIWNNKEFAARLPSAIMGSVFVLLIGVAAWRLWQNWLSGIIATGIAAFYPLLIVLSRETSAEIFQAAFVVFSAYAAFEALEGSRIKNQDKARSNKFFRYFSLWNLDFYWLAIAFATQVLVYFIAPGLLLLPVTSIVVFFVLMAVVNWIKQDRPLLVKSLVVSGVCAIITFCFYLFFDDVFFIAETQMTGFPQLNFDRRYIPGFAFIGMAWGMASLNRPGLYFSALWLVFYLLFQHDVTPALSQSLQLSFMILLAAYGVVEVLHALRGQIDVQLLYRLGDNFKWRKQVHVIFPVAILLALLLSSPWFLKTYRFSQGGELARHPNWKTVVAIYASQMKENEPVVTNSPHVFKFYLHQKERTVIGAKNTQAMIEHIKAHPKGWFVHSDHLVSANLREHINVETTFRFTKIATGPTDIDMYRWKQSGNAPGKRPRKQGM